MKTQLALCAVFLTWAGCYWSQSQPPDDPPANGGNDDGGATMEIHVEPPRGYPGTRVVVWAPVRLNTYLWQYPVELIGSVLNVCDDHRAAWFTRGPAISFTSPQVDEPTEYVFSLEGHSGRTTYTALPRPQVHAEMIPSVTQIRRGETYSYTFRFQDACDLGFTVRLEHEPSKVILPTPWEWHVEAGSEPVYEMTIRDVMPAAGAQPGDIIGITYQIKSDCGPISGGSAGQVQVIE